MPFSFHHESAWVTSFDQTTLLDNECHWIISKSEPAAVSQHGRYEHGSTASSGSHHKQNHLAALLRKSNLQSKLQKGPRLYLYFQCTDVHTGILQQQKKVRPNSFMHWLMKEGGTNGKWERNKLQCFSLQREIPFLGGFVFIWITKTACQVKEGLLRPIVSSLPLPTSACPPPHHQYLHAQAGQGQTKATFFTFETLRDSFLLISSYLAYFVSLDSFSCSPSYPTLGIFLLL